MTIVNTTLFDDVTLLPLQVRAPSTEAYEWKTNIITSYNGSEEPFKIRNAPRRKFDFTYPSKNSELNRAFNVIYGSIDSQWAVPVWMEMQYVGSITGSSSSINLTTTNYDFRNDSLALIFENSRNFQIVEIQTVNVGSIDLYGTTNAFTNAYVMPIRIGHIENDVAGTLNAYNGYYNILYVLDDNIDVSVSAPTQFLSNDIYFDEYLFGERDFARAITKRIIISDEELGLVGYFSPWTNSRVSHPLQNIFDNIDDVKNFRDFLFRRSGRYRQFWQPSFLQDFHIQSTGSITTTVDVLKDDYDQHADIRNHIAFEDNDGNWYARTIDSYASISGTQIRLTLDSTLGGIDASNIKRISSLGLKRMASDSIQLKWIGGSVCQVDFDILELSP